MKRFLICFVLILTCLLIVGCSQKKDEGLDEFEQLLTDSDTQQESEPFAQNVYVIIPQKCSPELASKAGVLGKMIYEKTGVPTVVKYDNELTLTSGDSVEILVGNTNRLLSQEALKSLRLGDYVCFWDRGSIILGGRYEDATIQAIDAFVEAVLHGASSASLMGEDVRLENRVSYDVEQVMINGYDLYDYKIVYSVSNARNEKYIATVLRDYIAKKSGYLLDIIDDTELNSQSGKVICIGDLPKGDNDVSLYKSSVKTVDKNIYIYGERSYELSTSAAEFAKKLFSNTEIKKVNADFSTHIVSQNQNSPINVGVSLFRGSKCAESVYDICQKIKAEEYDFIILGSMPSNVAQVIRENRDSYTYQTVLLQDGVEVPMLYDATAVSSVSYKLEDSKIYVNFTAVDDGKKYYLVYSTGATVSAQEKSGYGLAVIETAGETKHTDIGGLDFVGQGNITLAEKTYSQKIYVDSLLELDTQINNDKKQESTWATSFCTLKVRGRYCEAFISLANASK